MENYQVFISYRRDGGESLTGRIADRLSSLGYCVFYDVESIRSGTFNAQIFEAIDNCQDVLLILPPMRWIAVFIRMTGFGRSSSMPLATARISSP